MRNGLSTFSLEVLLSLSTLETRSCPLVSTGACKDAIDTLKERVPLWKKEIYEGGEEWIGRGS
jgi:hypothetical protein